jgi:hypothetical protein
MPPTADIPALTARPALALLRLPQGTRHFLRQRQVTSRQRQAADDVAPAATAGRWVIFGGAWLRGLPPS